MKRQDEDFLARWQRLDDERRRRLVTRGPPLPEHCQRGRWGTCRWCDKPILKPDGSVNKRRLWHHDCVGPYKLVTDPETQSRAVLERDGNRCAECRCEIGFVAERWHLGMELPEIPARGRAEVVPAWCSVRCTGRQAAHYELDHVIPLWRIDRTVPGALWFWTIENLQHLCVPCHRTKTKREAAQRAAIRRAARPEAMAA